MTTWPIDKCISFRRTTDTYGFFSNFHRSPVNWGGFVWPTSEHLYQAAKFGNEDVISAIANAPTPKLAKQVAYQNPTLVRVGWDDVKTLVMREVVGAKVNQHAETATHLFDQIGPDFDVVEHSSRDQYWGASVNIWTGQYVGKNVLGQIWSVYKTLWLTKKELPRATMSGCLPTKASLAKFFS